MPRAMAAHPHAAARLLLWRNAYRYRRKRTLAAAALIAAGCAVLVMLPPTGPILGWLGSNWAVTFVITTCGFALSTARRRQRAEIEASTSWLAALPASSPVRLHVQLGTIGRLSAIVGFSALVWLAGAIDRVAFSRLAFGAAAGALVGLLAGWRLPRAGIGAPGFHSAIVRRPRARWASAPSLLPLGNWPAAQGRVLSRPKKMAPILFFAMMGVPAGVHGVGQVALAVAGVSMALFSVLALSTAAVRVASEAARWLAPTTVGQWRFSGAFIWRVVLTQGLALLVLILLAAMIDLPRVLAAGLPLAALYWCASSVLIIAATWRACRRVGLGA